MLLRTIFLLALIATIAETMLHAAAGLARAALHQRAVAVAQAQFTAALSAGQRAIALAIQGGADPGNVVPVLPPAVPQCALRSESGCALTVTTSVVEPTPMPSAAGCPNTNCTIYAQSNDAVDEGRITLRVDSAVTSESGVVLAERSGTVALRTFRIAPYATLVGALDAANGATESAGPGDDGGAAIQGSGTLVNAVYENAVTGKLLPGNVWQSRQQHPVMVTPAWDY